TIEKLLPVPGNRGRRGLAAASVIDHDVGLAALFVQRLLRGFASSELGFGPASLQGSLQSRGAGSIDEPDRVADGIPGCFEHDRGIEDGGWSTLLEEMFNLFLEQAADPRVRDGF